MSEFDTHADRYADTLDSCLGFSGTGSWYFARCKASYLMRLLGPGFSGRVLDYGCGVGLLSEALKDLLPGARFDGYDVSSASLRLLNPGLPAQGTFTDDLGRLRNDYDAIVVSNVLHHIEPGRRGAVVSALRERLAGRGVVAVFEHNPYNPVTRWIVRHCAFDKDAVLLPPRETLGHLRSAGLASVRRDFVTFVPGFLSWLFPLEVLLSWCPLGAQYVAMGRNG